MYQTYGTGDYPLKEETKDAFFTGHYGRRDIAQRIKTTDSVNHLEPKAIERIDSERERLLFGLHPMSFYDGWLKWWNLKINELILKI